MRRLHTCKFATSANLTNPTLSSRACHDSTTELRVLKLQNCSSYLVTQLDFDSNFKKEITNNKSKQKTKTKPYLKLKPNRQKIKPTQRFLCGPNKKQDNPLIPFSYVQAVAFVPLQKLRFWLLEAAIWRDWISNWLLVCLRSSILFDAPSFSALRFASVASRMSSNGV